MMDLHRAWSDRGRAISLDAMSASAEDDVHWPAVSRSGRLALGAPLFSIWLQLRGGSAVEAREGVFRLAPGDWIAFEGDSRPVIQAERKGLVVGLALAPELLWRGLQGRGPTLFAGRGRMPSGARPRCLRQWREAGRRHASAGDVARASHALQPLLGELALLQRELTVRLKRCPGRSRHRKGEVFRRLQRARLYLEGHRDRVVSLSELSSLASFSRCYFSKTFHAIYDETPQAASQRLRLERACELLAGTTLVVGEVGAACGFDNACSFARAFRVHVGTTASAYRARHLAARARAAQGF